MGGIDGVNVNRPVFTPNAMEMQERYEDKINKSHALSIT